MIQEKKNHQVSLNFYSTESFIIPTSIIHKHHEQFPPNYRGLELTSPAPQSSLLPHKRRLQTDQSASVSKIAQSTALHTNANRMLPSFIYFFIITLSSTAAGLFSLEPPIIQRRTREVLRLCEIPSFLTYKACVLVMTSLNTKRT